MRPGDLRGDVEPEPGAVLVRGEERVEDLFGHLARDAGAAIDDLDHRRAGLGQLARDDGDPGRLVRQAAVATRVLHQVPHHLV